jgi:hypothetical protein
MKEQSVMTCNEIRELMPDLAAGLNAATPATERHLHRCVDCAGKLAAFRQTMALLDEWQAPEPSAYFDVRLQASLREEQAKQAAGWLHWIRRPALVFSLALVMVMSVTLFRTDSRAPQKDNAVAVQVEPGTAVGDLQALDKNHDLYSDFDVLDDLEVQQNVSANP